MSQKPETRIVKAADATEARKLRSILFDTTSPLTLSPIQVFLFSMSFIFMVFIAHILGRIFPSASPVQLFIAIITIIVSAWISLHLNRTKR